MKKKKRKFKKDQQIINFESVKDQRHGKKLISAKKKTQKRRGASNSKLKKIYFCVFIVIMIIILFYAYKVLSLKMNQASVEADLQKVRAEKEKLERELELIDDSEYIEQQARARLRMIKPGEILYVLPEDQEEDQLQEEEAVVEATPSAFDAFSNYFDKKDKEAEED